MFQRISHYFSTTVMPWQYTEKRVPGKLNIGWFSLYPPYPNGVAVMTRYVVREFLQREDVALFALPFNHKIDKKLFPGIRYAKPHDEACDFLDAIIFFSVPFLYKKSSEKYKNPAKSIIWHTMHAPLDAATNEQPAFEHIKTADLLCAPTKLALQEFTKQGIARTAFIPEGIPLDNYRQGPKRDMVIFVSRNHYYKGITPFLDAATLVLAHHPSVLFKLHAPTDKNSPYQDEVQQQIISLVKKYPHRFFYEDRWLSENELITLYAEAKILVFPSNNEGFGIPLVEAMASGCVCLTSDKAPMNELVLNGKTGYCLPLEQQHHEFFFPSPSQLAQHIEHLLEDEKLFQLLSQQAVKHAQQYDIKKTVDCFIEQTKKLLVRA